MGSCNRAQPIDCRGGGRKPIQATIVADLRGWIDETPPGGWQPKPTGRPPTRTRHPAALSAAVGRLYRLSLGPPVSQVCL